jgi:hypothetical protein
MKFAYSECTSGIELSVQNRAELRILRHRSADGCGGFELPLNAAVRPE